MPIWMLISYWHSISQSKLQRWVSTTLSLSLWACDTWKKESLWSSKKKYPHTKHYLLIHRRKWSDIKVCLECYKTFLFSENICFITYKREYHESSSMITMEQSQMTGINPRPHSINTASILVVWVFPKKKRCRFLMRFGRISKSIYLHFMATFEKRKDILRANRSRLKLYLLLQIDNQMDTLSRFRWISLQPKRTERYRLRFTKVEIRNKPYVRPTFQTTVKVLYRWAASCRGVPLYGNQKLALVS